MVFHTPRKSYQLSAEETLEQNIENGDKKLKLRARATFHGQDSALLGEILQEKQDDIKKAIARAFNKADDKMRRRKRSVSGDSGSIAASSGYFGFKKNVELDLTTEDIKIRGITGTDVEFSFNV